MTNRIGIDTNSGERNDKTNQGSGACRVGLGGKKVTKEECDMLDELLDDDSDRLNSWEIEFIENLNQKRNRPLTEPQADKLQQIWDKVF